MTDGSRRNARAEGIGDGADARELLGRYLRQRVELGETEWFLDGVTSGRLLDELGGFGATRTVERPKETGAREDAAVGDPFDAFRREVLSCTLCRLAESRTTVVFGEGDRHADLMVVGEAPGREEDRSGRPFVGAAGQLLDRMLLAIGFARPEVFICNVLKCRPPKNRDPLPDEVASCRPYLRRQIQSVAPRAIGAFGRFAAQSLLGVDASLSRLRGRVHELEGVPVVATYHPAALLRNRKWKRPAWEDLQLLRRVYDEAGGRPPGGARG